MMFVINGGNDDVYIASADHVYVVSTMKRQECLSSLQSVDSAKLCVNAETATNGSVSAVAMQPPSKSCRVGISYWSVSCSGTQPQSKDCRPQNGLSDTADRPRIDSSLSEGEQVNVFTVDEVSRFCCYLPNYYYYYHYHQHNYLGF